MRVQIMNRILSPGSVARHTTSTNGSVRSFFAATARYRALLRLSILPALLLAVLVPVAQGAQFTLTWTDNSTNETGFRIERSSNGSTFAEIATVGANIVSYVDAGLPNSTAYWYRLRAYNTAGNSGYSNVATGTTPPPASNAAPTISDIANQTINAGSNTGALAFTVGDAETAAASLTVTRSSSNTTLVPTANVVLGGSGANRTVTVTPASGQTGTATITVTVSDGSLTASDTFVVTVAASGTTIVTSGDGFVGAALSSVQSGSFTVEFDVTPSSGAHDAVVGLSTAPATSYSDLATVVRFNTSGTIDARNGGAYAAGQTLAYAAGLTYRVRMVVSVPTHTYSVYVTAPGGGEVLVASDYSFRTEQASVSSLGYWNSRVADAGSIAVGSWTTSVVVINTAPTISDITNRTINEDTNTGAIAFIIGDAQTAAGSLSVTRSSSNTTLVPTANIVLGGSGANRTITVTPTANQSGTATITVTVSDGSLTASDSFVLTVSAVNDKPTISAIANRSISQDTSTGSISFTVGDVETSASSLSLTASSSNSTLVPGTSIIFGGSGASRTVAVTPTSGQSGSATITVTVSDGSATETSNFTLTVVSTAVAPTISGQPTSSSVVAGGSASFSVTATGTPTPTYQWRLNGTAIAGATSSSYSIASVQASHAGTYAVVVSNSAGSVTSAGATLTVTGSISIVAQPESQTIAKNTTATLSVTAVGAGLSYQWYSGQSGDVSTPISGATSAAYTTPKLSSAKSYWVRVSASGQSMNSITATISIVDKARVGSGPIKRGNGAIEAAPILAAGVASDGTFTVMITQDGTLQMLAIDAASGIVIDAGGVVLDDAGGFSFAADGLGTVSGQVAGNVISGSVPGTDITFSGTISPVDGSTKDLVGWYNGVILNSSDGEVVVVAGPDGTAFVLTYYAGSATGGLVIMDTTGTISVTLPDGRTISLAINPSSGRLTGTTVAAGRTDKVSGNRSGDALEKRLVNTSVRAQVRQGDALMVAGFVVGGSGSKRVLVRAVGPTLGNYGVSGVLADPVINLFRQGNTTAIAQNDNWSSASNAAEVATVAATVGAFRLPAGSKDAALLVDLPAGSYTAQVSGANGETGMALVEVYDVDSGGSIPTNLANISMRGIAGNDADLVIAGFVVTGNAPKQVLIRAVGPELTRFGIGGVAVDPMLTIFSRVDGTEVQIATNNDWGVDAAAVSAAGDHVGAFKLASGSRSSAMVIWLEPGVYTAQASSNTGSSGVAIVEVYEVQ